MIAATAFYLGVRKTVVPSMSCCLISSCAHHPASKARCRRSFTSFAARSRSCCSRCSQSATFGFMSYVLFFCFSSLTLFFRLVVGHENAKVERRVVIFVTFVEVVEVAVVVVVAEVVVLYDLRRSRIDTGGAEVAIQLFRRNRPERLEYDADFPGARLDRGRCPIPPRLMGRGHLCGEDYGQVVRGFIRIEA